jgi:hypothetical protein
MPNPATPIRFSTIERAVGARSHGGTKGPPTFLHVSRRAMENVLGEDPSARVWVTGSTRGSSSGTAELILRVKIEGKEALFVERENESNIELF